MNPTRRKLLDATAQGLTADGISALSARSIAHRAGVNQALIFYHFGTVDELILAAVRTSVDAAINDYADRWAEISTLTALLALGRELHQRETGRGNVAQMAQVLAGAQHNPALAEAGRYALQRWAEAIEPVVRRVLATSPVKDLLAADGLAHTIVAGFLGLELYEGADPEGARAALATLEALGDLLSIFDELGPVTQRAVRAAIKEKWKTQRRRAASVAVQ